MIEHDVTVTLTPEDIELYDRARAINLPTIVVSMYGDRIKMLLAQEREACAQMLEAASKTGKIISCTSAAKAIRARGQA